MRSLCDAAATAELVKKDLAAAAMAPPCLVAKGEKGVPLAPGLGKPSGVFLHCTPSSAMAGAQCRSAAVARVAPGDGPHVGENVVQALVEDHVGALIRVNHEIGDLAPALVRERERDYSGNSTATHQPLVERENMGNSLIVARLRRL